eukprot:1786439-Prymnesium_polylepis.1
MFVVGRASFWYALPHPLGPVTRSPNTPPPNRPVQPSSPLLATSSTGATRGDDDSLWRSIDEQFLSQMMLLTDEECPRDQ